MLDRLHLYTVVGERLTIIEDQGYNQAGDYFSPSAPRTITLEELKENLKPLNNNLELFDQREAPWERMHQEEHRIQQGHRKWRDGIYGPIKESPVFEVCILNPSKVSSTHEKGVYITSFDNIAVYQIYLTGKRYSYFPDTYSEFLKSAENNSLIAGIQALFNDYSYPKLGLFFTFHWNRSHQTLANKIRDELPNNVENAYDYLIKQRQMLIDSDTPLNPEGSFMQRIDFAISQLVGHMKNETLASPILNKI